jgi:hypothetical protein
MPLPFTPTDQAGHNHVVAAANAILMLTQGLFEQNPAPVIAALKAAEYLYTTNAEKNGGMETEAIEEFEVLGIALAKQMLEQHEKALKEQETGIKTPDSRLVGPDGQPLVSTKADEPSEEPVTEENE